AARLRLRSRALRLRDAGDGESGRLSAARGTAAPIDRRRPGGTIAERTLVTGTQRFVIVGAGLAGASAAAALREGGFDGQILLVGAEPHLPYNRPPLSKAYLRGEARFEDGLGNPADFDAPQPIERRL